MNWRKYKNDKVSLLTSAAISAASMSFYVARVYRILAAALSATHPLTPLLPQPFPGRDSRAPWPRGTSSLLKNLFPAIAEHDSPRQVETMRRR